MDGLLTIALMVIAVVLVLVLVGLVVAVRRGWPGEDVHGDT